MRLRVPQITHRRLRVIVHCFHYVTLYRVHLAGSFVLYRAPSLIFSPMGVGIKTNLRSRRCVKSSSSICPRKLGYATFEVVEANILCHTNLKGKSLWTASFRTRITRKVSRPCRASHLSNDSVDYSLNC